MRSSSTIRDKQVQITVFDNEPMARMAEQRLRQEGIPSLIRSLHGGPGLWGSAYNLPHGLYVYQSDVARARDILGIAAQENRDSTSPGARSPSRTWLIVAAVLIVAVLIITAPAFLQMFS